MDAKVVSYSELKTGDVVAEWGTEFKVVEVNSWMRRDVRVWSVTTEAVTTPDRVLYPFVKAIGDEWVLQGSGSAATVLLVRYGHWEGIGERMTSVGESVNASGVYRSAHVRCINGEMYAFHREVRANGKGRIEVYRGTEVNPCKVFTGTVRELPGMMHLSAKLGTLIKF